jgi:hypothetical protein
VTGKKFLPSIHTATLNNLIIYTIMIEKSKAGKNTRLSCGINK